MRRLVSKLVVVLIVTSSNIIATRAVAADNAPTSATKAEKCEHGVKKSLCARCNPKLVPVYKAKGDWCEEHQVPESQCARCNPKLAKEGVK
jgi:hypothetical protein